MTDRNVKICREKRKIKRQYSKLLFMSVEKRDIFGVLFLEKNCIDTNSKKGGIDTAVNMQTVTTLIITRIRSRENFISEILTTRIQRLAHYQLQPVHPGSRSFFKSN